MISRHPLKQAVKRDFKKIKVKLTKADKTRAKMERIKNHKAQNLPKKNAQEDEAGACDVCKLIDDATKKVADKKRYSLKNRRDVIEKWGAWFSKMAPAAHFVTPRRPVINLVPEKYYKVLHIDIQKLDDMEIAILRREMELKSKNKKKKDVPAEFDRDDEDVIETKNEKDSKEKELFTIVWLLIGGNDKFECQWVNAEDMYFL